MPSSYEHRRTVQGETLRSVAKQCRATSSPIATIFQNSNRQEMSMAKSHLALKEHKKWRSLSAVMSVITDIKNQAAMLSERRRQRRALAQLNDRLLEDIGLSAEAALTEIHQPFWH